MSRLSTRVGALFFVLAIGGLFWLNGQWLFGPKSEQTLLHESLRGWEWTFDKSIVYTWVNGSDPGRHERMEKIGGNRSGPGRDRDNQDFLHSLRSLDKNMPWHRGTIYIVSPTPPDWLNLSHPRIKWIDQDTLVPQEFQPFFSSNVVEQFLYRIPGLSDQFIQVNDDCMMMRLLHPSDFFTVSGGVRMFLEMRDIKPPPHSELPIAKQIWLSATYHTARTIQDTYGPMPVYPLRYVKHAPFVYYKEALERVRQRFLPHFDNAAYHPFRTHDDIITPLMHQAFLTEEGPRHRMTFEIVPINRALKEFHLMKWTADLAQNEKNLDAAFIKDPKFVTFQDELGDDPEMVPLAQKHLARIYNEMFPWPSQFEKAWRPPPWIQ